MSLYDILLDDLLSKSGSKLNREQVDKAVTRASNAVNMPKWYIASVYGEVLLAYTNVDVSMYMIESGKASVSESELSQIRENILQMAEEE